MQLRNRFVHERGSEILNCVKERANNKAINVQALDPFLPNNVDCESCGGKNQKVED